MRDTLCWRLTIGILVMLRFFEPAVAVAGPRIVNVYNFIRNSDYRLEHSEEILFDCTRRQIELLKGVGLPATWALQYDALVNPRYQKLLKEQLGSKDEIGAWWEIPRQLAEKAGIRWRGAHDWDPVANVGFSPGYTPDERRALVDVYMADFKAVFGFYPRTAGSWFIDEVTLEYMSEKYGLIASCNCKDQIGTDFYTLWGGYWNQAYYPSRVNAYMPAQTRKGQIDVPVFRMLGSDPIYQHGTTPGLISLEPVYKNGGGGMPRWVDWFMRGLIEQPALAFGYTQAGQENSFGWEAMKDGLTYQARLLAEQARAGKIRVETLEQSGRWFRNNYRRTPATAVVALEDWKGEGRKTVWYNSRYYRLNLLWESNTLFIRDLHCFAEQVVSPTHNTPLKETSLTYETLPIVDWAGWSASGRERAGMWPVRLDTNGAALPLVLSGEPAVREINASGLEVRQGVKGGGSLVIICREAGVTLALRDSLGKSTAWACDVVGGARLESSLARVSPAEVGFSHAGVNYSLKLGSGAGAAQRLGPGGLRLLPDRQGELVLRLDMSAATAAAR
jgi:hypothetical protein